MGNMIRGFACAVAVVLLTTGGVVAQERKLTVVSWGGSFQDANREALWKPYTQETGVRIVEDSWNGEVGKIRAMTDYEETQYASPVGRRGTLAHAQSFGEAPEELRKSELIEFLHRVASAVEPHLKGNPAPVVLAAHPEIQGHFREIAGWREIQPDGISENPDALSEDELHRRATIAESPRPFPCS